MPERRVVQDWFTAKNPIISSWSTLRKIEESTLLTLLWEMRSQHTLSKWVTTATCSRVYSLTVLDAGDVYFSDVNARKVGRLTGGVNAEYVIGSGKETPCDGCQKTASFVQLTWICAEGSSLYWHRSWGARAYFSNWGNRKLLAACENTVFLARKSFMTRTNFDHHSSYGRCYTVLWSSHNKSKDQCCRESYSRRTPRCTISVSYTHLTLPTSDLV